MKVTIFLIAALAVSCTSAFPASSFSLVNEMKDFVELLPQEKMALIFKEYFDTDEEVQNAVDFMNSADYKNFVIGMESVQEYQTLLRFFQSQGIDVYGYLEVLHQFLRLPAYVPPPIFSLLKTGKGLKGLIQDLENVLPMNEIAIISAEKLETSEEYKRFYNVINSAVHKKLFCACVASEDFQEVIEFGRQHGFDPYLIQEFALKIFNIEMVQC